MNTGFTRRALPLRMVLAGIAARAAGAASTPSAGRWRILLVVAHPDDEYYFAGTVYRLAQELDATVDQVVITNGEAGYRYSALAAKYYGAALTDENVGRSRLPAIRKKETLRAGKILGVRHHYFLGERDFNFTLNAADALRQGWDHQRITDTIRDLIRRENYDFVFTILPRSSTHGHHQAAGMLTTAAIMGLPEHSRPALLGAEPGQSANQEPYAASPGLDWTRAFSSEPAFTFRRSASFGYRNALRYDIVVNWVIAEHKSQGMFQNDLGTHDVERFWLMSAGAADAPERMARLSADLFGETVLAHSKGVHQ